MGSMLKLNPAQQRAVGHGEGPLLIIAGPGSGKTRVITERIVYLLEEARQSPIALGRAPTATTVRGLRPENILALTFTDKAADEMKRRVRSALPDLEATPHISTFHSFCYEVLRKRHFERVLLDKVDVWIFLRRRMEKLELEFYRKLAEPGAFLHALNEFFSRCQDELIEPEDFENYVRNVEKEFLAQSARLDADERKFQLEEIQKLKELARVFCNSRKLIEEAGCSSLGSLIPETVRLFDREPDVLRSYRERFQYALVDEFQDTNYAQVELLKRLVKSPYNITAVGDDDQAIYRFRGASHGAFQMFDEAFPGHATVYLDCNYRSTKRILRVADAVIARNDRYAQKPKLHTDQVEGSRVFLLQSPDYASEAAWIAEEADRLRTKEKVALGDIAVLYRAHSYRDALVSEFRLIGIPFAIRGLSILSTIILRDLLAYLNVIHSLHDNISLTRVLLAPRWDFPEETALEVRTEATRRRCSLYAVLESREKSSARNRLEETRWPELKAILSELRKFAEHAPMTALLDRLIERLEIKFLPHNSEQFYVNAFRKFLEDWEAKSESRRLREFMEYFGYFLEAGGKIELPEPASPADAVQMMTVHAAKGLEFPVVFILSVAPRRFPHSEQKPVIEFPDELRKGPQPPKNIHEQEERRLFYVAMTRAKERLYISSVSKSDKKPSLFIDQLLSDPVVAARDLERIEVPEAPPAAGPVPLPRPQPARAAARDPQSSLFATPPNPSSVHPDIFTWASRPPALPRDEKLQLSASAIEAYRDCPQKFKFSHYLKIPTGPQPALTFGNIMHQCVSRYFKLRKQGEVLFEDIEKIYLESWKDAGFEDKYQEEAYKRAGLEQLQAFVEKHERSATLPIEIEMRFTLDLGEVILEGRIDQINPLTDHAVELVDYKTGRPPSQKDADQSLQLSVYALAVSRDKELNSKPARLTFYSLTNNQPVSTVRTDKDLEEVVVEVREVAEQIRQELFPPKPGFVCKYCDYVMICPAHEEEYGA